VKPTASVALAAVVALCGCAATNQLSAPRYESSQVIDSPFDRTWAALVASIADQAMPVQAVEKESGLLTTSFVTFDPGRSDREIKRVTVWKGCLACVVTSARYTLSAHVSSLGPDSTRVRVTAHVEAYQRGFVDGWTAVPSNGAIESDLIANLRSRIDR
jgi:hypothetical protein